jgi:hypothetical protein
MYLYCVNQADNGQYDDLDPFGHEQILYLVQMDRPLLFPEAVLFLAPFPVHDHAPNTAGLDQSHCHDYCDHT